MTNEEWKLIENKLQYHAEVVRLIIDGYKISITQVPVKPMRYELGILVDGKFQMKNCLEDCDIRRRFCQPHKKSLLSAKGKAALKRKSKAFQEEVAKKLEYYWYSPTWSSFRSMKSHLIKNNISIELDADDVCVT